MAWHYLCIELHSYITCVLIYIFQSGRAEKQKNEKQEKQRSRKRLKTRENRKRKKRRSRKQQISTQKENGKNKNSETEKQRSGNSRKAGIKKKILNLVKKYINNHPYINRFTHSSTAGLTAPPPGLKEFALQVGRPMRDSTLPCRGTWMFIPIQELLGNHSDEGVC